MLPQAAFTMKELRELTKLSTADFVVDESELERSMTDASTEEVAKIRVPGRIHKLLHKQLEAQQKSAESKSKKLQLRFLLSPTEIVGDPQAPHTVGSVRMQHNTLVGEAGHQRAVASVPETVEDVGCGLILSSIGYKSESIDGSCSPDGVLRCRRAFVSYTIQSIRTSIR